MLSGSSFEVLQYFQVFLRCCWGYFQFAQILLTNGSWICPKVHQCNGSKAALLIWKNRIFWIKFVNSRQCWNWTYLKFLLQPTTIYSAVVSNFQHLPPSVKKCNRVFIRRQKLLSSLAVWQIATGKRNKLSDIIGREPDNHDLFETSPFKKRGGRSLHCLSSPWEGQQLLFVTLTAAEMLQLLSDEISDQSGFWSELRLHTFYKQFKSKKLQHFSPKRGQGGRGVKGRS